MPATPIERRFLELLSLDELAEEIKAVADVRNDASAYLHELRGEQRGRLAAGPVVVGRAEWFLDTVEAIYEKSIAEILALAADALLENKLSAEQHDGIHDLLIGLTAGRTRQYVTKRRSRPAQPAHEAGGGEETISTESTEADCGAESEGAGSTPACFSEQADDLQAFDSKRVGSVVPAAAETGHQIIGVVSGEAVMLRSSPPVQPADQAEMPFVEKTVEPLDFADQLDAACVALNVRAEAKRRHVLVGGEVLTKQKRGPRRLPCPICAKPCRREKHGSKTFMCLKDGAFFPKIKEAIANA